MDSVKVSEDQSNVEMNNLQITFNYSTNTPPPPSNFSLADRLLWSSYLIHFHATFEGGSLNNIRINCEDFYGVYRKTIRF
jgi:hypothetical protein